MPKGSFCRGLRGARSLGRAPYIEVARRVFRVLRVFRVHFGFRDFRVFRVLRVFRVCLSRTFFRWVVAWKVYIPYYIEAF